VIVARFKAATGMADREIALLLGVARSTVQGAVTGAQTMRLTDDAKALMAVSCLNRIETLKQLHKDLQQ
jgi:hypothetical protein